MINWKIFEAKYENREQWAFEQMSYFLFCIEILELEINYKFFF